MQSSQVTFLSPLDRYEQFEGLQAEECGILNGCENGRCIRVPEGYTCDCYDGYRLDMTRMACIGKVHQYTWNRCFTCVKGWKVWKIGYWNRILFSSLLPHSTPSTFW